MSGLRFRVVSEAFTKKALQVNPPTENISEYYGRYVFGRKEMAKFLSKGCMQILVIPCSFFIDFLYDII